MLMMHSPELHESNDLHKSHLIRGTQRAPNPPGVGTKRYISSRPQVFNQMLALLDCEIT